MEEDLHFLVKDFALHFEGIMVCVSTLWVQYKNVWGEQFFKALYNAHVNSCEFVGRITIFVFARELS
jgi:hypothetical protein